MSQAAFILVVELPQKQEAFIAALSQIGRSAQAVALADVPGIFACNQVLGIVAPEQLMGDLSTLIRESGPDFSVPFFVLQAQEGSSSLRPYPPEVTARVSEDVDPGILAMRFQIALQSASPRRPRQPTMVGMGSTPPATTLRDSAPAPDQSSQAPAAARPAASGPPAPPSSAPPPSVQSSAPPISSLTSQDSAPGSSSPQPSAPSPQAGGTATPQPSPPSTSQPSSPSTSTSPSVANGSSQRPVSMSKPVGQAQGLDAELDSIQSAARTKKTKIFRIAGAGAVVIGAGAALLLATSETETVDGGEVAAQSETQSAENDQTDEKDPPTKPSKGAQTDQKSSDGSSPPSSDKQATDTDGPASDEKSNDESEPSEGEASLFAIQDTADLPSCEEVLGKPAQHFANASQWRGPQEWKLSRQSLMAGKEQAAHEHMCKSAFIDPKGSATSGLVKYYLGKRALEQAHLWAQKHLEVASSANAKRSAQQLMGDVLCQMGKMEKARSLWLKSFNLEADQKRRLAAVSRNFVKSAVAARRGGDLPLAERLLRRAAAFTPDEPSTAALLADTLLKNEQPELARRWAERALSSKPDLDLAQSVMSATTP